VRKCHIARSTDPVQPNTYLRLGIMDSNVALLGLVQLAQNDSLGRHGDAML
jgi:hypothetical protein